MCLWSCDVNSELIQAFVSTVLVLPSPTWLAAIMARIGSAGLCGLCIGSFNLFKGATLTIQPVESVYSARKKNYSCIFLGGSTVQMACGGSHDTEWTFISAPQWVSFSAQLSFDLHSTFVKWKLAHWIIELTPSDWFLWLIHWLACRKRLSSSFSLGRASEAGASVVVESHVNAHVSAKFVCGFSLVFC